MRSSKRTWKTGIFDHLIRDCYILISHLACSEGGPLPTEIIELIDQAWLKIKGGVEHYAF